MSLSSVAALAVVIAFAFTLGVSDAPNAGAVLIAARAASYRSAMAFSFVAHAAGGVIAGQAVALTMASLVRAPAVQLPGTYLAGGVASLAFTLLLTRRGVPVSANRFRVPTSLRARRAVLSCSVVWAPGLTAPAPVGPRDARRGAPTGRCDAAAWSSSRAANNPAAAVVLGILALLVFKP